MITVNEIIKLLKDTKEISDYEILTTNKQSSELFFVLKKLEMNRATNTQTITIKVYCDFEKSRGSSTIVVTSADTTDTLQKKIHASIQKAKTAFNLYYPLTSNQNIVHVSQDHKTSLNAFALKVADAIMEANDDSEAWINATEIFVSKVENTFINSNAVEQYEEKYQFEFEMIPTASNGEEEYELYDYYRSDVLDVDAISKEVKEKLQLTKARAQAKHLSDVQIPKDIPVFMYGEMADVIVQGLLNNATYMSQVTKSNHYVVNDVVSNTPFSLVLEGNITGVSASKSFDEHGVTLMKHPLIQDGKLIDTFGDIQFGYYSQKKPTGNYQACSIECEGIDITNQPHLIIDAFSAPQLEKASGYFGGEVRLARYFDGEKYIPLTAFTVSGNLYEAFKDVQFSKEIATTNTYKGPKYFIFSHLDFS